MAAKGYLRQKWWIVFKGPWMLYFKESHGGKKSVRAIILLRSLVTKIIPNAVVQEHNISKALHAQKRAGKLAEQADQKSYMLAFNVELELEQVFKLLEKLEDAWSKISRKLKKGNIRDGAMIAELDEHFQAELIKLLKQEDSEEKEIYWKYLEPVIKTAENKSDSKAMMAKVAQMFKTKEDISRFAAIAFKWGARAERKGFVGLSKDLRGVQGIVNRLGKKNANVKGLANSLREMDKKIIGNVKKEFKSTYLLLKRDMLMDLVLLGILNKSNKWARQFIQQHLMPKAPELENMSELNKVRESIKTHGHILAQGLRRLIAQESNIRGRAERELYTAKRTKVMAMRRGPAIQTKKPGKLAA